MAQGASGASVTTFRPNAHTPKLYAIQGPSVDPVRQQRFVEMSDGVKLYVEVWLPARANGRTPPERVPTIASISPYVDPGALDGDNFALMHNMVPRGYAYAQVHVRGTGSSGGCHDLFGQREQQDVGEIVRWLVDDAPWSDGSLGIYGISYRGTTALEAITVPDDQVSPGLKAVVIGAPAVSVYDAMGTDGVPNAWPGSFSILEVLTIGHHGADSPEDVACARQYAPWVAEDDGDFFAGAEERELRKGVANIRVPVLMTQGHMDPDTFSMVQSGLFDRIPNGVPNAGLFGHFGHEWPDGDGWNDLNEGRAPDDQLLETVPEWTRDDWQDMVVAWFDHFVKGIPSGVERWPVAQVQGNDGLWRAEEDWPFTGGPEGALALGSDGALGDTNPTGSTSFIDGSHRNQRLYELDASTDGYVPGTSLRFEFEAIERLEIVGQPVVDLWVSVEGPVRDAHLTAQLETFDAHGNPMPGGWTMGARSVQHLDPIDDYFKQRQAVPAPEGVFRVPIRLRPTDLVVPTGGTVRLTLAGSAPLCRGYVGCTNPTGLGEGFDLPTRLSGSGARVTIFHDCEHTSALRFTMPSGDAEWLEVKTIVSDRKPMNKHEVPNSFDGGAATQSVCVK